jgi:hypothetical protein
MTSLWVMSRYDPAALVSIKEHNNIIPVSNQEQFFMYPAGVIVRRNTGHA